MNSAAKIFAVVLSFSLTSVFAESASDSARMANQIDNINGKVNEMHAALVASPLDGKSWGVEVNPVFLLFVGSSGGILTGTVSNFSWNRSAEIAFPVEYGFSTDDDGSHYLNLDAHYRYFLGERQRGFYLSGFARFQNVGYRVFGDYPDTVGVRKSMNRGGIGMGLGYRVFSRSGIYWGFGISVGRYLVGNKVGDNTGNLTGIASSMGDMILDVELLKIGFAF